MSTISYIELPGTTRHSCDTSIMIEEELELGQSFFLYLYLE